MITILVVLHLYNYEYATNNEDLYMINFINEGLPLTLTSTSKGFISPIFLIFQNHRLIDALYLNTFQEHGKNQS